MTHPNTDSRELEQLIKWLRPPKDYVVDDEKLKQAILAYTANKQIEELERLHRYDGKDYDTELDEIIDDRIEEILASLKNKKESL